MNSIPQKLESLQVFRGLAAISVVFYHIDVLASRKFDIDFAGGFFGRGNLGVDFFFVLSGFIIALIHWRDRGQPEKTSIYLLKRILRVVPLLFTMNLLKFFYMLSGLPGFPDEKRDLGNVLSSFLMLPAPEAPLIDVAWTLRHEMFFYLIFTVVILWGARASKVVAAVMVLFTTFVSVSGIGANDFLLRFLFHPHNLQFLVGVSAALLVIKYGDKLSLKPPCVVFILLFCGIFSAFHVFIELSILVQILAWGLLFGLAILISVLLEKKWRIRYPKLLILLGDASYSIYLIHSSVQVLLVAILIKSDFSIGGVDQWLLWGIGFISIISSIIGWKVIEQPLMVISCSFIKDYKTTLSQRSLAFEKRF